MSEDTNAVTADEFREVLKELGSEALPMVISDPSVTNLDSSPEEEEGEPEPEEEAQRQEVYLAKEAIIFLQYRVFSTTTYKPEGPVKSAFACSECYFKMQKSDRHVIMKAVPINRATRRKTRKNSGPEALKRCQNPKCGQK